MPEPCVVEETQYFGCYVSTYPICTTEGYWGELTTVDASAVEPNSWGFYATSRYILEGDIWLESALSVTGDRVSQHVFHISGDFQFYQCMLFHACQHIEIALIRFSGDPAAFDAVDPKSVYDLVAANLIDDTDVLFVQTDFPSTSDQLTPLEIDVPVTGIRDEHLYLFSTFETPLPEPGGPVSLGVGALALAGLARRRSRSVRSSGSSR